MIEPQRDGAGRAHRCECRRTSGPTRLLAHAGIPARYDNCSLDSFQVGADSAGAILLQAKTECRRYVESFLEPDGGYREGGLLFIGPPGVGKTHLAVAVLRELIETFGVHGRFVDFTTLLHEIQATFDPASPGSKSTVLDPVTRAEVLVLDELGAQKPTPWVSEILYLIINSRYSQRLPTLFTTNYELSSEEHGSLAAELPTLDRRIPARLLSRLYEMAKPIRIAGVEDFRREILVHQHHV